MCTAQAMGIFCQPEESQRECGRLQSISTTGARERECKAKHWTAAMPVTAQASTQAAWE